MTLPASRPIYFLVFAGCVFMMAVALFMEHYMMLEPCPLCILQRVGVVAVAVVALMATLHNPGETGIQIYGGLMILMAALGAAVSGRQLWLQSLPEDQVPACGPGLDYLMDVFPMMEVLEMILAGDGTCAEVVWSFLGLSIPGWVMVGFIGLISIGVFQVLRPEKKTA